MKRQDRWGHYGESAQVETALDFNAIRVIIRQFVEVAPQLMQCPVCQADNLASAVTCEKCSTPFPLSDATISPSEYGQSQGGRRPPRCARRVRPRQKDSLSRGACSATATKSFNCWVKAGWGPFTRPETSNWSVWLH